MPFSAAEKPNPALASFGALVGEWTTVGTHPYIPGKTLHGRTTGEWIYGGAFFVVRSEMLNDEQVPSGIAIFGSDDDLAHKGKGVHGGSHAPAIFMIYFDSRGVSRKYDASFEGNVLTWWRTTPEFSQKMVLTIKEGGASIESKGEMKQGDSAWEPDLQMMYTKVQQ